MGTSISRRTAVLLGVFGPLALAGCSQSADRAEGEKNDGAPRLSPLGEPTPVTLDHATKFTLDAYEGGYRLASLASGDRLLVVPEGVAPPAGLPDDVSARVEEAAAREVLLACREVVCCVSGFGTTNARNAELLDAARAAGIPVRHEGSRAN